MSAMPSELVDDEHNIRWVRADRTTRGKATAFFAQELDLDFTEVRVTKVYMHDPGPECDCGAEATCGVSSAGGWGESFNHMTCADCQRDFLDHLADAVAISLEEATPYDGWKMMACAAGDPGATPYWEGTER